MVAPPSLEEVQQAVQEASDQAKGRRAEEVLKELLERVVEAALGQAEGGGEGYADEMAESDKQSLEEEVMGEMRDANVQEETEYVSKSVDEGKDDEDGNDHTATGPADEALADLQTGSIEDKEGDFTAESPVTKVIPEVVGESIVASREPEQVRELQETYEEQVEELERGFTGGGNAQESEHVADDVEMAVNAQSDSSHLTAQRETTLPFPDDYEIKATHTVEGELWEEENIPRDAEEQELEDDQGHVVTRGWPAEVVDAENSTIKGPEGGERHGLSGTGEESVPTVDEAARDQLPGEQTSQESFPGNKEEDKGEECF